MFKRLTKRSYLLFTLLLLVIVYWIWLIPGVRVSNDLTLIQNDTLKMQFDLPRLWHERGSEGLGNFGSYILWSWPANVISGLFAYIGIGYTTQLRIFFVLPVLIFGTLGINKLLSVYNFSSTGKYISTITYLTSTYLLLLLDGGQLSVAVVFSMFPLLFYNHQKIEKLSLRETIVYVFILQFLVVNDVRMILIYFFLIVCSICFGFIVNKSSRNKQYLFGWIRNYFLVGFILFVLNLYWIIPLIYFPLSSQTFNSLTSGLNFSPVTWKHALLMLQPHWYQNKYGLTESVKYEFILIPILAFFTIFLVFIGKLRKFRTTIVFWFIIAFFSIFLVKGSNPPIGQVYSYLFNNIPGFSLFRDSTKFFILLCLSYSVLIGFGFEYLQGNFIQKYSKINLKWVLPVAFSLYILYLTNPTWTGKMTGMFTPPKNFDKYFKSTEAIRNDSEFSRVLYLPSIAPLSYVSPTHPAVEAIRLVNRRAFAIGTIGRYEKLNYLREHPVIDQLLRISGIKYIFYPLPDNETEEQEIYYNAFLDQISSKLWIGDVVSDPPIAILQTSSDPEKHIFLTQNAFAVVGSDRIYWDLSKVNNFDLATSTIVFIEEQPGILDSKTNAAKVILYDKNLIDFKMTFLDNIKFIYPSRKMSDSPDNTGWWKREAEDLIWWRDFLQTKYKIDNQDFGMGGGWAIGEGDRTLEIRDKKLEKGKTLFARVMTSSRGGRVEFWQGDEKIGEIATLEDYPEKVDIRLTGYGETPDQIFIYDKADVHWFEVGELVDNGSITIRTTGNINVINSLLALSEEEMSRIDVSIQRYNIINWTDLNDDQKQEIFSGGSVGNLTYKRINPTKYEININQLNGPTYLIFSETYNENWELNGKKSTPVYSLLNGFYVEKPGKYTLYFTPQKYVYPGLVVSGITFIMTLSYIIYPILRKKI